MKLATVVLILLVSSSLVMCKKHKNSKKWKQHKEKFAKVFHDEEHEEKHFERFEKNSEKIRQHNDQANATYEMNEDHPFVSYGEKEKSAIKGAKHVETIVLPSSNKRAINAQPCKYSGANHKIFYMFQATPGYVAPAELDWTKKWNTPVRNQGQCGCCYSFAAAASIEALLYIKSNKTVVLGPQDVIDCSLTYENGGCDGGVVGFVYEYAMDKGICLEKDYSFKAAVGSCVTTKCTTRFKLGGYLQVSPGSDAALIEALNKYGPIAIGVDATDDFLNYKSGVFTGACSSQVNHAILLVGYGTDPVTKIPYWKIKNSWDVTWGEKGYGRIARNVADKCGITRQAFIPSLTPVKP